MGFGGVSPIWFFSPSISILMYPDVFWCILRKYCILAYPDVFWNVFSYLVVCDRDTLCFMYCDVSWCILSVSDAEDEIHGGLIGAPPHPSLPPDLQTDSGYIYTSCSLFPHISCTSWARIPHICYVSERLCQDTHLILVSHMYPTCILHASCMYPACILSAVPRYTLEPCILHHVLQHAVLHVSCMYPHAAREDPNYKVCKPK